MIGIIDYGLGNLSSVFNALKKIKFDAEIFSEPKKTPLPRAVPQWGFFVYAIY